MSSDEYIRVALNKAKKFFFRLGTTWKVQQQNLHCVEELVLRGLQERAKLSKCRISSNGHKLPEKWEVMVERIMDRVYQKQIPQQRPDGSFHPGVMDANMGT